MTGSPPPDPPEGTPPGETPPEPVPDPTPRCEVCGSELDPDQTYCLECGSPTPLAPRLRRGRRNLAILAAALAVLGVGAGALAYAVARDDDEGAAATVTTATIDTQTVPVVPLPPETAPTVGTLPPDTTFTVPTAPDPGVPGTTTGFDTVTGPSTAPTTPTTPATTASVPTPTTAPTTPTPSAPGDSGEGDWPDGETAWTAILSSVRDEGDARAAKRRVAGGGDPAGVFFSSDFADLRPGYWVVFSGTYASRATAIAQATKLRPAYPEAYARRIQG